MKYPIAAKAAAALASSMGLAADAVTPEPGEFSGFPVLTVPDGVSAPRVWCGYVVKIREKS